VVAKDTRLKARHVNAVVVHVITWGEMTSSCFTVEPLPSVCQHEQILIPRGVVSADCTEVTIQVTNPGWKDVNLTAGLILADVDEVDVLEVPSTNEALSTGLIGAAVKHGSHELPEHLHKMVDDATALCDRQRGLLEETLIRFEHCFEGGKYGLGRTDLATHVIDTNGSRPIKIPARRLGWAQQRALSEEVDRMLKLGVIEPSSSPWSSPPVLVRKKDNSYRFCVDYRRLNAATKKDAYPLPRIEDCLDSLAGAKWFCTLDLSSGYWQIAMAPEDKEKTAFTTPRGHFQFTVMPFGVTNGPATLERLMELVLGGLDTTTCLCYMDDIVIRGATFDDALSNLVVVLKRIGKAGLRLKPSKCELFRQEVSFLGHIVCREGVKPDPKKIEVVKNWPVPTTVSEVRSFLGFASYYRKYVAGFSQIAGPLNDLTSVKSTFKWTSECQEAFEHLIKVLISAPILALPREGCPVILDTDACDTAIGGVLSQMIDGHERVVAYASKSLSSSQRNYCATYRELLAVVKMAKIYRPYIYGQDEVLLRTDHRALVWLQNFKDAEGMLARWLATLSEYNFKIEYREGKKHGNADGCSRIPIRRCKRQDCPDPGHGDQAVAVAISDWNARHAAQFKQPWKKISDDLPSVEDTSTERSLSISFDGITSLFQEDESSIAPVAPPGGPSGNRGLVAAAPGHPVDPVTTADGINQQVDSNWVDTFSTHDIVEKQSEDPALALVKTWVESWARPTFAEAAREPGLVKDLWAQFAQLFVRDEKLCRHHKLPNGEAVEQLVLPTSMRRDIFSYLHGSRIGGHMGIGSLIAKVRRRFYWPGYKEDIIRWTKWCDVCQRRTDAGRQRAALQSIPVGMPMERMAVDILGPLQVTERGNRFIVVIADYFTKWTEAFALPNHKAATVADCLVTEVITRFGAPHQLHSDQGADFESKLFQEVCKLLGINKTRTCSYRPQSDGLVERFNRTLQDMLSKLVNDYKDDWDDILPYVMCAYRATPQQSTGISPNMLMLGREAILPVDLVYGYTIPDKRPCPIDYVEWVRGAMEDSFKRCKDRMAQAAERQAKHYNKLSTDPHYAIGDWVLLYYPPIARQKLSLKFLGPYRIARKLNEVNYEIEAPTTGRR